jgi:phosphoribosylanthranilate isomerase
MLTTPAMTGTLPSEPPHSAPWIKICGITRVEDANVACEEGANAVGLNFVEGSPRRVAFPVAISITAGCRGLVTRVGLFVDPDADTVRHVLDRVELDLLQFHGDETPTFCRSFGVPYIKALPVRGPVPEAVFERFSDAFALLLDAWVAGRSGGTGHCFDWSLWPSRAAIAASPRLILAGGLTPDNVHQAVLRTTPWGVDVSGGVEGSVKGVKDHERIRQFIRRVRQTA